MDDSKPLPSMERHYSPMELAKIMSLSRQTIYRMLEGEPGVIRLGERGPNSTRFFSRVPGSVWARIHEKYTVKSEEGYQKPRLRTLRNDR